MHNIWKSRNSMLKHMLNANELNTIYKKSMKILSKIDKKELLNAIKLEFQEKNNGEVIKKNVRLGKL